MSDISYPDDPMPFDLIEEALRANAEAEAEEHTRFTRQERDKIISAYMKQEFLKAKKGRSFCDYFSLIDALQRAQDRNEIHIDRLIAEKLWPHIVNTVVEMIEEHADCHFTAQLLEMLDDREQFS